MARAPGKRKPARPARKGERRGGPGEGSRRAPARKGRGKGGRPPKAPRRRPAPSAPEPAAPAPAREPDEGQARALLAVQAGLDKKAGDPVVLDVRGLSGVADYFVVLSADSERQAAAVADAVDERLEAAGASRLGAEGRSGGSWVLLDFGDVVVHVMEPETRRFYDLEGLWADAPRVRVEG